MKTKGIGSGTRTGHIRQDSRTGHKTETETPKKTDTAKSGKTQPVKVPTDRQTTAKTTKWTPKQEDGILSTKDLRSSTIKFEKAPRPKKLSPLHSALRGFRTAKNKEALEFSLNYPDLKAALSGAKLTMMTELEGDAKAVAAKIKKFPHLQFAKDAMEKAGLFKLGPEERTMKFIMEGDKIAQDIPDSAALKQLELSPPSCGTTANHLRDVFLGEKSKSAGNQHADSTGKARKGELKEGSPVTKDGVTSGVGVGDLKKLMSETTKPLFVQINLLDNKGYGHAFVLEQLPRKSVKDPQRGFLHQSFIGTHTLAEWTKHAPEAPVDLGSRVLDKLAAFSKAKSGKEQLEVFSGLFLRPGQDKLGNAHELKKALRPVKLVFTASHFNAKVAAKNADARMKLS